MVLVDLRNHGRTADMEGLSPPHDTINAARDIANLVKSLEWAWPDVVIGHSLGGKVALQYALSCAQGDYGDSAQLPKQVTSHSFSKHQMYIFDYDIWISGVTFIYLSSLKRTCRNFI